MVRPFCEAAARSMASTAHMPGTEYVVTRGVLRDMESVATAPPKMHATMMGPSRRLCIAAPLRRASVSIAPGAHQMSTLRTHWLKPLDMVFRQKAREKPMTKGR